MLLVVGWDGASFDVIEPFLAAGDLPVLASLVEGGAARPLRSTWPAVTFPAWTTFLTGCEPERHGLLDFTVRRGYAVEFVNAGHRRVPTLWGRMSASGLRVGSYAVPATFPPEPLRGVVVCGFDTPLGSAGRPVSHPPELAARLQRRYGTLAVGGPQQTRIGPGWHRTALREMLAAIHTRTDIVTDLIQEDAFDCFFVHFGESDTVCHHFWHHADRHSPRHQPGGCAGAIADVYRALDASLGRLIAAAGADAEVMVLSDHGSGGTSDRVIFWNRWLADRGWLAFRPVPMFSWPPGLRRAALRLLPRRAAVTLFRRLRGPVGWVESSSRFAGIDWTRTRVFSEELSYSPSLCINIRGREPAGIVDPAEVPALIERLREDLLSFVDPCDGGRVVEEVEVAYEPGRTSHADLRMRLRRPGGYAYAAGSSRAGRERAALRRLRPEEMTGARGTSMGGSHRPVGMCVLAGPRVRPGRYREARLADAGATVLAMLGLEAGSEIDGRPWLDVLELDAGGLRAAGTANAMGSEPWSKAEERELAAKLRSLGYLE